MSEKIFESSLSMEEIENNFKDIAERLHIGA